MLNGRAAVRRAAHARLRASTAQGRKMSKSLGNVHRAAEAGRSVRRRNHALVGRVDRLLRRPVDLRRDPEARRRELSPHPQHAALPAREHVGLRSGAHALPVDEWLEIDRYAIARLDALQIELLAHLDEFEFHPVVVEAADVLLRRPRRLLSRRAEGPPLHDGRGRLARAARRRPRCGTSRNALLRLLAPFLSFTAEEAWAVFAPDAVAERGTIFAETVHVPPKLADADALLNKWHAIRDVARRRR